MEAVTHTAKADAPAGGERLLVCDAISRSFGGLKALKGVSLDVLARRDFRPRRPERQRQNHAFERNRRLFSAADGKILFAGRDITGMKPHRVARLGVARTFQNLALFRGLSTLDNILMGRHIHMHPRALSAAFYWWWAKREEVAQRRKVEEIIEFRQLEAIRDEPIGCDSPRPSEARRTGPRARCRAEAADPRRADGRHEPGRKRIYGALRPRHPRGDRRDRAHDRASHGRGGEPVRPHGRAELWRADRGWHA